MSSESKDYTSHSTGHASGRLHPLDWARTEGAADIVERAMIAGVRRRKRRQALRSSAVAAVLLAIGGTFWLTKSDALKLPLSSPPHFVAMPAMRELMDGSIVELNATADIRVEFSDRVRRVFLNRGEAHFQVAKNADRPFVVVVQGVEVKAIGTAFSVQLEADEVNIVVTEGRIAVGRRMEAPPLVHLDAGEKVVVHAAERQEEIGPVTKMDSDELAQRMAWRIPMLELDLTPLGKVIPILAAHAGTKISLADPSLAELKLTGRLRANNLSVLLQILESSYGLRVEKTPAGEIVVHPAR